MRIKILIVILIVAAAIALFMYTKDKPGQKIAEPTPIATQIPAIEKPAEQKPSVPSMPGIPGIPTENQQPVQPQDQQSTTDSALKEYGGKIENANPFAEKNNQIDPNQTGTEQQQSDSGFTSSGEPLLSYPLSNFVLLGTYTASKTKSALIEGPDKKVYRVLVGEKIGSEGGQIASIKPNQVEIDYAGQIFVLRINSF